MNSFEDIVRTYQKPIYFLCYKFLRNHSDSDEAMQKTFLKAYEKLDSFQGRSSLKTWLFAIAINTCKNEIRSRKNNQSLEETYNLKDNSKDALEKSIEKEQKENLLAMLEKLSSKQKEVIILRTMEGNSFSEIAKILGISENSAKVNFHHGLTKLKDIFGKGEKS